MSFVDQLGQFLGEATDEEELADIATAVLSASIRRLKFEIAESVWESREMSAAGEASAVDELERARALKRRYDAAVGEYERVRG